MRILWATAALLAMILTAPVYAQTPHPAGPSPRPIHVDLEAGTGKLIDAPNGATDIFVADPKVVDVRPATANSLFIFGVAAGHTTVAVLDKDGHAGATYDVMIQPSTFNAGSASAAIARALPGANIRVDAAPKGLVLTGQVTNAGMAETAQGIAHSYLTDGQEVENRLTIGSPQQVGLRVRIVEMSRTVTNALGINWQALASIGRFGVTFSTSTGIAATTGTPNSSLSLHTPDINALINALATESLVRVLAEPNLTAISGESASFLAGGEFPIPVGQSNNTVTIEFKQYGVALAFVPTVINDHEIRLRVRPEVSELTQQGAVQISAGNNSISVPALTVRRADTTVELGSGQSFAIAGLLQYNATTMANYVPLLGDVPVLGELFRSEGFQRNETELVIIVTPYLVAPVNNPAEFRVPGEGLTQQNDMEIMAVRRAGDTHGQPPRIPGQAGFIMP